MTEVRPFGTCAEPTTRTWKPFKLKHYSCIWAPSKALRFVPSLWTLGRCPRLRWKVSNVRHWAKCVFAGDIHSGKALFSECCEYQALGRLFISPPFGFACVRAVMEMGLDSLPMNLSNKLAIWLPWTPETPRNHLDVWGKRYGTMWL